MQPASSAGDSRKIKAFNFFKRKPKKEEETMLEESVTDFRNLIEEKLKSKKDALDQTEQHLKKFSIIRDLTVRGVGNNRGASLRGRLGPPPKGANRQPLGSRLGPKISNAQDEDDVDFEGYGLMSRVVVEKKSRDDALAEEDQKMDKKEKQVCLII